MQMFTALPNKDSWCLLLLLPLCDISENSPKLGGSGGRGMKALSFLFAFSLHLPPSIGTMSYSCYMPRT